MASHDVTVFGLGYDFLFKSNLGRCVLFLYFKNDADDSCSFVIVPAEWDKFYRIVNYPMV